MAYEYEWAVARRGSVRHARLTRISAATVRRLDADVADFVSGPYNAPLAAGVLACAALTAHPLPREVRTVDSTNTLKVCSLCQEVLDKLEGF